MEIAPTTNDLTQLILFAPTNAAYEIDSATNLVSPISWSSNASAVMTNPFYILPLALDAKPAEFFRAKAQSP